jgi:hypothetical protein
LKRNNKNEEIIIPIRMKNKPKNKKPLCPLLESSNFEKNLDPA